VPVLIPDYLSELEEAEARRTELDAQVKSATASRDDEDGEEVEETISPRELRELKTDLAAAKRKVRSLEGAFIQRLGGAVQRKLDEGAEHDFVLRILKTDLQSRLDARMASGRRVLVDRFRTWTGKYVVTLRDLEAQRDSAVARLESYLKELGYA
jgi:type I restriction enzyme M protein